MAIDPAAPPWSGPAPSAARQHLETPFAELHECGLLGVYKGIPVTNEQHYWPTRSPGSKYGRQVPCKDSQGKLHGNPTRRFGAQRPVKPKPDSKMRWHCAADLGGEHLDMIVACQSGQVVEITTFHLGTWAMMVQNNNNGLVFSYNEIENGSWKDFDISKGSKVVAGQPLARVGLMSGKSSMLHFEVYQTGTTRTYGWEQGSTRPAALRDPTRYLLYLAAWGA